MRHDPTSVSGWVKFPIGDPDYRDTGEGGLTVHALFLTEPGWNEDDPFIHNAETALTAWLYGGPTCCGNPEDVAAEEELVDPQTGMLTLGYDRNETGVFNLLASVCLGSTGGSFHHKRDDRYFTCTREDLAPEGVALIEQMERLYQRPAVLITTLDT